MRIRLLLLSLIAALPLGEVLAEEDRSSALLARQGALSDPSLPIRESAFSFSSLPLSQREGEEEAQEKGSEEETKLSEPRFTGNKIHQYLGLASLFFGAATIPLIPDDESEGNDSLHSQVAVTAYALGMAAIVTGFMYHSDDIFEFGATDPDNRHMTLGIIGTLGYLGAIANAPKKVHAVAGAVGLISMSVAVWLTW